MTWSRAVEDVDRLQRSLSGMLSFKETPNVDWRSNSGFQNWQHARLQPSWHKNHSENLLTQQIIDSFCGDIPSDIVSFFEICKNTSSSEHSRSRIVPLNPLRGKQTKNQRPIRSTDDDVAEKEAGISVSMRSLPILRDFDYIVFELAHRCAYVPFAANTLNPSEDMVLQHLRNTFNVSKSRQQEMLSNIVSQLSIDFAIEEVELRLRLAVQERESIIKTNYKAFYGGETWCIAHWELEYYRLLHIRNVLLNRKSSPDNTRREDFSIDNAYKNMRENPFLAEDETFVCCGKSKSLEKILQRKENIQVFTGKKQPTENCTQEQEQINAALPQYKFVHPQMAHSLAYDRLFQILLLHDNEAFDTPYIVNGKCNMLSPLSNWILEQFAERYRIAYQFSVFIRLRSLISGFCNRLSFLQILQDQVQDLMIFLENSMPSPSNEARHYILTEDENAALFYLISSHDSSSSLLPLCEKAIIHSDMYFSSENIKDKIQGIRILQQVILQVKGMH